MWAKSLPGWTIAETWLLAVYFYNGKLFAIRTNDYEALRYDNFKIVNVKSGAGSVCDKDVS